MSIFILLLFVDFYTTLITVLVLLFLLTIYFFLFSKKLRRFGEDILNSKNSLIKWILQSLNSIKDIKISKKESKVMKKFTNKVAIFENLEEKLILFKQYQILYLKLFLLQLFLF